MGPHETLSRRDFDQHDAGLMGPSTECMRNNISNEIQSPYSCDSDAIQPIVDGLVDLSVTCSLVGSSGMLSHCDSVIPGPANQYVDDDLVMTEAEVNQTDGSITTDVSSGDECDSETWDGS